MGLTLATTAGVDLAADISRTALAVLEWTGGGAVVRDLVLGVTDDDIVAAATGTDRTGVDCPFGWPRAFVEVVADHAAGVLTPPASSDRDWRRTLAMRATDLDVHHRDGLVPLSVSTDRIAHPALRWAAVAARLADEGVDVRRDGTGRVCEVYPAVALRTWGLPHRGYKGIRNDRPRELLVAALTDAAPWLDLRGHEDLVRRSDDALDAVIAAVVARCVATGAYRQPTPDQQEDADIEGWICVPTRGLGDLAF